MSSSITPPPTGGGNAKYAVVLVVLVGGMAALLAWRTCGSTEGPKTVALTFDAAPPPTLSHVEDDVPPPPVMPEAGPDTGPVKTPTGVGTVVNACGATKCNGTSTGDLESALAFRAKQAHRCYDSALANDSTLKGHVGISVRVAHNGQVCSAGVASNDMGSTSVAQCVANMFRQSGHFPPPAGGCVDATVPISFVPGAH